MEKSNYKEEQIVFTLKQAELGARYARLCGICRNVLKQANAGAVRYCESTGDGAGGSQPGTNA